MKTKYFFFIIMSLFILSSCNEEDKVLISNKMSVNALLQLEQAKLTIYAMGFDTTSISEWGNYYVVEGDILIYKDSVNPTKIKTRQYRTNFYVNNFREITIGVNNTISRSTNWRDAVKEVVRLYNEYTGLTFVYSENNPNITIYKSNISGTNVCASGTFPPSPGEPGHEIIINSNFYRDIDTYLDLNQKIFLLMHELGHNLGLRHTNGISEGDGGVGLVQIPGTPIVDPNSFMNGGTCSYSWDVISTYDKIALEYLWPCCRISFAGSSRPGIKVPSGYHLSRFVIPTSIEGFCGWYEDAALTIPWKYVNEITSDITLYPKWILGGSITRIEDTSDTSYSTTFTLSRTALVSLQATVGRGFNEWWDISKYTNQTGVALGKSSSIYKMIYLDQYIWNANPESYMEYIDKDPIILDPGTYWLSAFFTPNLGLQYGASGKHGVTTVTLTYY